MSFRPLNDSWLLNHLRLKGRYTKPTPVFLLVHVYALTSTTRTNSLFQIENFGLTKIECCSPMITK